jgi:hypothetical protein
MSFRRTLLLDSLILLCLSVILIKPLFRLKYLDNWPSIESTFIAEARMLSENLPHPGWQPLWYCGTRTDYIYPPALLYGTVLISKIGHTLPARSYHLYIAIFYVLGIVAVYWLVRIGSRSRVAAWLASLASALISPSFALLKDIRHDSGFWVPQRLHVLMAYGEGPHISALCVLPAALAAGFLALRKWRPGALAAAGALCALVAANNFYGATGLAILYPIMVWSVWTAERDRSVWLRAASIPLVAYGLSAFWLTPSYIRITMIDLNWVARPGNTISWIILFFAIALFCFVTWRSSAGRREREWPIFVTGAAFFMSLYVLGLYYFGFRVMGEPGRLIPELDLALILAGVEIQRTMWRRPRLRIPAVLLTLLAFAPSIRYLRHVWSPFPKAAPIETVYEYKTSQWVHDHLRGERVLPSGSIRFWFDAWADNPQPDGGSMQGMLNQILPTASWQILRDERPNLAVLWLQALGTSAVVVPDRASPEPYHDYAKPEKFQGLLPVLYDDGHGTLVYRVPRVYPGIARVVEEAQLKGIGEVRSGNHPDDLATYVSAIEDPARPEVKVVWHGFDEVVMETTVKPGEDILLQETWDPAWHADENGKALPVRVDPVMGFMLIDVPEGMHKIRMRFETPLENRVGQVLFFVTIIVLAGLMFRKRAKT